MAGTFTLDPDRDPWDQQPGESDADHAPFVTYLSLGPSRNLRDVAVKCGCSLSKIEHVSGPNNWTNRAAAYEVRQAQLLTQELAAARISATRRLIGLEDDLLDHADTLSKATPPDDMLKTAETALKVHRALFGEPQRVEISGPGGGPIDYTHMTPGQLAAALRAFDAEIRQRATHADDQPA